MFTTEELRLIAEVFGNQHRGPLAESIAGKADRLVDYAAFRGVVYVDLPRHDRVGVEDESWTNVHVAASTEEAVAWVNENVGGCDPYGNINLLTCGDPEGDRTAEELARDGGE